MNLSAGYSILVCVHVTSIVFFVGTMLAQAAAVKGFASLPQTAQAQNLNWVLRFDRMVTTPALAIAWATGLSLASLSACFGSKWLIAKLVFVVWLSALHGFQSGQVRRCLRDNWSIKPRAGAGLSIVVSMLIIAILAIVKPF